MTYNAFDELADISFFVSYPGKEPMEVVLARDLQQLMGVDDASFEEAVMEIKFSAAAQEINLKCFFHTIDEGDIMTTEAAIAVASRGSSESEFTRQMVSYVRSITDFCLNMQDTEVDSTDDD